MGMSFALPTGSSDRNLFDENKFHVPPVCLSLTVPALPLYLPAGIGGLS
ncbi:hypothetical protein [Rhodococcus sovatensis]|uniref:Uncharacterized protein n=1 Tax=Rhodococcus sovatensis TaxID=1805840 RepID=A0ABZ2PKW8_9NOCA